MAKHIGTYFTFNVIVLDLLMLINFSQKRDTNEIFNFKTIDVYVQDEKKKQKGLEDKKRKKGSQVEIGKIQLNL